MIFYDASYGPGFYCTFAVSSLLNYAKRLLWQTTVMPNDYMTNGIMSNGIMPNRLEPSDNL